jgi:iron complex outermembrane recepter protein
MFKRTKISAAASVLFSGIAALTALPTIAQEAQRIEITGSSIRRIAGETALPVTVIKVEDLTRQGVTSTEQAIARIASNQSNFGASAAIGGTTGGKSEADLRGLGGPTGANGNKTLVLLNGRRLANHPFDAAAVDLNAIPLAAVDRIEVLRDGASALYGTDAIGGVINFILKREFVGFEVSAQATKPQASGGGDTQRVNLAGGFGALDQQRFNFMASLDWRKQSTLEAKDREFSKTGIIGTSRAAIGSGTSGTSFPGDLNGFEPSGPTCNPPSSIPRNTNPDNTGAFQNCRYDFSRDVDILTNNEQLTGLLRGSFAISPDHTASVEYLRANNKSIAHVAPVPQNHLMPQSSPFFPVGAPLTPGGIPDVNNPTGPNVPGGVANWRAIPGGKRTSGDDTTSERLLVELQGTMSGWDYKTAIGTAKNKSEASVKRGYLDDDAVQLGVFNGVINPFGDQTAAGLTAIDAAQINAPTLIGTNKNNFADFRVSNPDLLKLPGGSLGAAFGVEYRKESSFFNALDVNSKLQNSLGIDPDGDTSGSRKVGAAYAELSIPIIKDLEVTLAGRFDKYNDFGSTFNPKIGVRYEPVKNFLLRGSANKGFRAPTLYEIYQPASRSFTSDSYNDPVLCPGGTAVPGASAGTVCDQQVLQRTAGPVGLGLPASTLKPEKATNFTLGFAFEPSSEFSVGMDFWQIKIKNLISPVPEQAVFGNPTKYASRFIRCGVLSPAERANIDVCLNYPTFDPIAFIDTPNENLGELHTSGIDLSLGWRSAPTEYGSFRVGMEGTYVTKYKYQREINGEFLNPLGAYSDNAPVFRWQHVLTGTWNFGDWSALLAQRYKSGYTDQDGINKVGSYSVFDTSITWTGVKSLTLTAGINNLLDTAPPKSVQNNTFQRGYDPRFTDPLGRTFVLRAAYKFF